jgi:ketosteroid isomerase-like protein
MRSTWGPVRSQQLAVRSVRGQGAAERRRDEIINEFLGSMGPAFVPGTLEIELVSTIAEDDRVVAEWTSRATTVHGGTYDNRCIGIYTVRDGKISSVVEYADTHHVAVTLFPDEDAHSPAGTE